VDRTGGRSTNALFSSCRHASGKVMGSPLTAARTSLGRCRRFRSIRARVHPRHRRSPGGTRDRPTGYPYGRRDQIPPFPRLRGRGSIEGLSRLASTTEFGCGFHGCEAVAPLKGRRRGEHGSPQASFPRLRGRGSIEGALASIPRLPYFSRFHGCEAVAPLKGVGPAVVEPGRRVSTAARPWLH